MLQYVGCFVLATIFAADETATREIQLTTSTVARFAKIDDGREILTTDDAFTASLSRFDLQCRLKNKEASLAQWKRFAAAHVRSWEMDEIETVSRSLERL